MDAERKQSRVPFDRLIGIPVRDFPQDLIGNTPYLALRILILKIEIM